MTVKTLKLGMVNYINTLPIVVPLKKMGGIKGWSVIEGHPSMLNQMLADGEIQAGLVSSYEYALHQPDYLLLPDLSISAVGAVKSVLLFSKMPFERLSGRKIVMTTHSATSVNLLRLVFEKFLGVLPAYLSGCKDDFLDSSNDCDAYLAIGDEALRMLYSEHDLHVMDLGEMWLRYTGLPFVFAVLAVRKDAAEGNCDAVKSLSDTLNLCRKKGRSELEEIVRGSRRCGEIGHGICVDYLNGIEHDLNADKIKGLSLFFGMLSRHIGIISTAPVFFE